ncbi:cuticle protein 7-like [Chironomus tepperi]|uniref:cuticle protein 7-like n=1 Tax=Chironomus tepperi TaxID=113505 RepID=UPI00391F8D09
MAFKFVILCATLAAVSAGVIETGWQPNPWNPHTATVIQPATTIVKQPAIIKKVVEAEAPANYEFNYEVHDTHTGDIKRQHEKAENGHISGQYSLVDPDGFRRVVSYTADDHHGFQANVQREPVDHKVLVQQPVVTKVIQPAVTKVIQPATITKVVAPAHGWQAAPAHGWQAPTVLKVQAPSHGWQPNPHAANPWG